MTFSAAPFGIYIHWPYCRSKCPYCDFFSRVDPHANQEEIVNSYLADLDYYAEKTGERVVTSVFFGGGTPSLLSPKLIERLLGYIAKRWRLSEGAEISLEANPNTDKPGLFQDLRNAGINRLSLGVQALNDADLKFLGRTHDLAAAHRSIEQVLKIFDNHSMDLIYARPGQTAKAWEKEIENAVKFGFRHLSLYQLTIEENTVFQRRGVQAMEDEAAVELYRITGDILSDYNLPRYEVSNYAAPEYRCRHNLLYWQGRDYLGIGAGAHGRLALGGRFFATTHPRQEEELSAEERAEELLLMGLRLSEGISKQRFEEVIGKSLEEYIDTDRLSYLQNCGLIDNTAEYLRVTEEGFPLLNHIITELWKP